MTSIGSVVAAVTTYGRTDQLERLLPLLIAECRSMQISAEALVVDNNPEPEACGAVACAGQNRVSYEHEPEPGIAAGRNRALQWATQHGFDAIAFIDDDETPRPGWLRALVGTAQQFGCAGVTGPVIRAYPAAPSRYVAGMRRWDYLRRRTGTPVPAASSANLLLDVRFLNEHRLRFDPGFGLSGGSDTLITRQLIAAGGALLWCDDAIVTDYVTPERMTPQWLRRRARRVGNTRSRVAMALNRSPGQVAITRARQAARGAALTMVGAAIEATGALAGDPERSGFGSWRRSMGLGTLAGAVGHTSFDYLRSPQPGSSDASGPRTRRSHESQPLVDSDANQRDS